MNEATEELLIFSAQQEWHDWLATNHASADAVWLKISKKDSSVPTITRSEALDEALCFGWIDGVTKTIDEHFYKQRYTPRRARSIWSKINIGHIERLRKAGLLQPAGLKQVELAKTDGRWQAAYDAPSTAVVPAELLAELEKNPKAKTAFEKLSKSKKYMIIFSLQTAKKPETKSKRIDTIIAQLEQEIN